jgi:hypothetical protein
MRLCEESEMKIWPSSVLGFVCGTLAAFSSHSAMATEPTVPYFVNVPSQIIVDISVQRSFIITGEARDDTATDIVSITCNPSPWMRFSSVPGNPATFRLWADHVGYDMIGVWPKTLEASDNATFPSTVSAFLTIRVVPEPSTLLALTTGACLIIARRRR